MQQVHVRLSEEIYSKLVALSEGRGESISSIITSIILERESLLEEIELEKQKRVDEKEKEYNTFKSVVHRIMLTGIDAIMKENEGDSFQPGEKNL